MAMIGPAERASRAAAVVAAALSLLTASGCTEPPVPVAPAPIAVLGPVTNDDQRPAPPRPQRKPVAPSLAALTPPKVEPAPAPDTATDAFDKLQGLDQDQIAAFLGQPLERAEAPPAVLWRYASRDCALDVYFYLDLESREMRVLHYEVRNTDGSQRPQQSCYDEFVSAHPAAETGSPDRSR